MLFGIEIMYLVGYNNNVIEIRETDVYKEWFESIKDRKTESIIDIRIRRISLGNFGDIKPVGKGVYEIKIDYGAGLRIYFFQQRDIIVILLCGGDKSTQSRDIRRARELAKLIKDQWNE